MTRAKSCSALLLWLALCAPSGALAGEEDGKTHFAEGRQLRADGRCHDAIIAFQRALATYPQGLGSLRNIAECQEELGMIASARRAWWDLRREVLKYPKDDKYKGWVADAEAAHKRLEPRVPRFRISLRGADPKRVVLQVDGIEVDSKLLGSELERNVGQHRVEVLHRGKVVAQRQLMLVEGSREHLVFDVTLPPEPEPEGAVDAAAITGFVFLGLGVAAFAGMGAALGIRAKNLADLEAACPDYDSVTCPEVVSPFVENGNTASTFVTALAIGGSAALAIGATLTIVSFAGGSDADGSDAATRAVKLRVALGYVGVEAEL